MIKFKHPLEEKNIIQENYIKNVAESDREFHELMFSYTNAVYVYINLRNESTYQDYIDWLDGLDEVSRIDMKKMGFEQCKSVLSFIRYINEKNDIGMDEFIKQKIGIEDYEKLQSLQDQ